MKIQELIFACTLIAGTLVINNHSSADAIFDSFDSAEADRSFSDNLEGYAFTVNGSLEVTGLGAFDLDVLGIPPANSPHSGLTVSLVSYAAGMTINPIASVVIGSGTLPKPGEATDPFDPGDFDVPLVPGPGAVPTHGFVYESITPVTLSPGVVYIVFANYEDINGDAMENEFFIDTSSTTINPAINMISVGDLISMFPEFGPAPPDPTTYGLTATPANSPIPFGATNSNPISATIVFNTMSGPTVPEPSSFILLGTAIVGALAYRRRRKVA